LGYFSTWFVVVWVCQLF